MNLCCFMHCHVVPSEVIRLDFMFVIFQKWYWHVHMPQQDLVNRWRPTCMYVCTCFNER